MASLGGSTCGPRQAKYRKWLAPERIPPKRTSRYRPLKFFQLSLPPLYENRKSTLKYAYCILDHHGNEIPEHESNQRRRLPQRVASLQLTIESPRPQRPLKRNGFGYAFDCFKSCRERTLEDEEIEIKQLNTVSIPSSTTGSSNHHPPLSPSNAATPILSKRCLASDTQVDTNDDCPPTPILPDTHPILSDKRKPFSSETTPILQTRKLSDTHLDNPSTETTPMLQVRKLSDSNHEGENTTTPILPYTPSFLSLAYSTDCSPSLSSSSPITPHSETSLSPSLCSSLRSSVENSPLSPSSLTVTLPDLDDDPPQEISFIRPIALPKRKKFDEVRVDGKIVIESSRQFMARKGQRDLKEQPGSRRVGLSLKESLQKWKNSRENPHPLPSSTITECLNS